MQAINAVRNAGAAGEPGARVLPLWHGPRVDVLAEGDLARIHAGILRILEGVGVEVGSTTTLERLRAAGAPIDLEARRVRLPGTLVEEAVGLAPPSVLLAARDPACDLLVDGTRGWLSTGGRVGTIVDLVSDQLRDPTSADVVAVTRLVDALPQIGFAGPSVAALDVPAGSRPLHELHAQVANTSKHVQVEAPADARSAEAMVGIGEAVAGGEAALRERPLQSAVLPVPAPLTLGGLDAALTLAGAGVPCGFVAMPQAGASAPATVAGALVTAAAEALAGVVVLQLLEPGAPVFVGTASLTAVVDGNACPGGPKDPLFQMAWVQLARRLGLRALVGAFATGSAASDWRAGLEGGLSGTAAWMTPPDLLAAAGMRNGGRVFSPVAMLLDTELFDLIRQIPLGFEVDEESLALEVIDEVGPGEHFLGVEHTLRHFREAWTSRFMDTSTWEAWEEAGRPEPPDHAARHARELLAAHEPAPLPTATDGRIREVIAEHERDHR